MMGHWGQGDIQDEETFRTRGPGREDIRDDGHLGIGDKGMFGTRGHPERGGPGRDDLGWGQWGGLTLKMGLS